MVETARPRHWIAALMFAAATAATAWQAWLSLFSQFAPYDDEGYILISLRSYLRGGRLYDEVYSQYGPFFYQALRLLFARMPADHDHAGLLTVVFWVAASLLCGLATYALSGRLFVAVAAQVLACQGLLRLCNEPLHPLGILALLLSIAVCLPLLLRRWPRALLFSLGALCAAVVLIKINVGAFLGISMVFALLLSLPARGLPRLLRLLPAALLVVVPFALMLPHFDWPWVRPYALHVAIAGLALGIVTARLQLTELLPRTLPWFAAGFAAALCLVVGGALLQGSSPRALVDAVVLLPLRMPAVYVVPAGFAPLQLALDGVALAAAVICVRWTGKGELVPGATRVAAGLILCCTPGLLFPWVPRDLFSLPLAFAVAVPPPSIEPARRHLVARCMLAAVAVLQSLHAYPVAGSQLGVATFLLLPIGGICIADGLHQLSRAVRLPRLPVAAGAAFLAWIAVWFVTTGEPYRDRYRSQKPLPLAGARWLHLDEEQLGTYVWLSEQLRRRCSSFVTLPGLNSLYLFSGMDPPTGFNTTSWMFLLGPETQAKIVEALAHEQAPCAVRNQKILKDWAMDRPLPEGPLLDYIARELRPIGRHGRYELLAGKQGGN